jgi:hypothetical protein
MSAATAAFAESGHRGPACRRDRAVHGAGAGRSDQPSSSGPLPPQPRDYSPGNAGLRRDNRHYDLKRGSDQDGSEAKQTKANNPQQSWGFEGEPPEAVIMDSGMGDGT